MLLQSRNPNFKHVDLELLILVSVAFIFLIVLAVAVELAAIAVAKWTIDLNPIFGFATAATIISHFKSHSIRSQCYLDWEHYLKVENFCLLGPNCLQ